MLTQGQGTILSGAVKYTWPLNPKRQMLSSCPLYGWSQQAWRRQAPCPARLPMPSPPRSQCQLPMRRLDPTHEELKRAQWYPGLYSTRQWGRCQVFSWCFTARTCKPRRTRQVQTLSGNQQAFPICSSCTHRSPLPSKHPSQRRRTATPAWSSPPHELQAEQRGEKSESL